MSSIAIDGPAGAGKSTIAKKVSKELNYIYVDTGAMYRAIALYLLREKVNIEEDDLIIAALEKVTITIAYENNEQQVILNDENVTASLRNEEVGNMASITSANKHVREKLLQLQRNLAITNNVVMDGRDIGTNVLPNANLKIFLTASSATRAQRRYKELVEKGQEADLQKIEADIIERDNRDMSRKEAPLKQANDAIYLDSSTMNIEEVVEEIIKLSINKI